MPLFRNLMENSTFKKNNVDKYMKDNNIIHNYYFEH